MIMPGQVPSYLSESSVNCQQNFTLCFSDGETGTQRLAKWQLCSVPQACPTLCNTMDCRMPGFPVFNHLPESAQTHVHWVDDAIQPPHPQSPPPPPAFNLSTSGSFPMSWLFISGGQSTGVSALASVLPMNTQDWSPLGWTGWIPCSSRDSQESSPTPQFKSINSSVLSFLYSPTHIHTWLLKKT